MKLRIRELKAELEGPCQTYGCEHEFHLHPQGWQPIDVDNCYSDEETVAVAVRE